MFKIILMSDGSIQQANVLQTIDDRPVIRHLLVPVKRPNGANQSIAYAIRRRAEGAQVMVSLLHIDELQEPRSISGNGKYVRGQNNRRAFYVFLEGVHMLEGLDIEFSTYVRTGPVVFSILDAAEQLDCSEIVVPAPGRLHFRLLSRNVVATLLACQRSISVVTVNNRGIKQ